MLLWYPTEKLCWESSLLWAFLLWNCRMCVCNYENFATGALWEFSKILENQGRNQGEPAGSDYPPPPSPLYPLCAPLTYGDIVLWSKPRSGDGVSLSNTPLRCYNSNEVCHSLKHVINFKSNKRQMRLNLSFLMK